MPQPSLRWPADRAGPLFPLSSPWPSRLLAALLLQASRLLARSARSIATPRPRPQPPAPHCLAFYAEAGAPEGALYFDGELVGLVDGARRL